MEMITRRTSTTIGAFLELRSHANLPCLVNLALVWYLCWQYTFREYCVLCSNVSLIKTISLPFFVMHWAL